MKKTCINGHTFQKTSDCPVCPVCESQKRPEQRFLQLLAAPARRALENEGILTLEKLATYSEKELLALHGFGKSSLPILRNEMARHNLQLKRL